jgi:hypothetical protein
MTKLERARYVAASECYELKPDDPSQAAISWAWFAQEFGCDEAHEIAASLILDGEPSR